MTAALAVFAAAASVDSQLSAGAAGVGVGVEPTAASGPAKGSRGFFNPACFIHTAFHFGYPLLQNTDYRQAIGDWYFRRQGPGGGSGAPRLADHCPDGGVLCNPHCSSKTSIR